MEEYDAVVQAAGSDTEYICPHFDYSSKFQKRKKNPLWHAHREFDTPTLTSPR